MDPGAVRLAGEQGNPLAGQPIQLLKGRDGPARPRRDRSRRGRLRRAHPCPAAGWPGDLPTARDPRDQGPGPLRPAALLKPAPAGPHRHARPFSTPVGVADLLDGAPAVTPIGLGPDVTRLEAHEPQISGLGSATVHTAALQHKGAACAKASSGGSGTRQYQGTVTAWANPPSDMNANGPRRPRTGAAVPPGTSGSGGRTGSSTRPPARPVRCLRRRCPPRRPRRRPRDPAPSESWPAGTGRPESAARCRRHRYNQKEDPQPQAEVNLLHERDTRAWCSTHNSSCRLGKPAGQPVTVKVADATLPLRRPLAWKVSFLPG
jgi:hypothetical protein